MHINQVGDLELLLKAIGQRAPQPAPADDCHSADTILDPCRTLYRNRNSALAIDFCVQRLPLEGLQVMSRWPASASCRTPGLPKQDLEKYLNIADKNPSRAWDVSRKIWNSNNPPLIPG